MISTREKGSATRTFVRAWGGLYHCIFTYGLFLGPQRRDVEATIDSTLFFVYIGVKPARLATISTSKSISRCLGLRHYYTLTLR
jgi:hypothetical protein